MKRMSKTTGNKVSIDENSSFARFALCGKTISVSGETMGINTPIRQKEESFWFIGYLVTGLEVISVQIHFSSVTYCFCTFVLSVTYCFCTFFLSFELSFLLCRFRNTFVFYDSVKIL